MASLTPRTWYLVGAGLMVSAVTMGIIAFGSMMNTIEGMRRVIVPGRVTITLPAGTSTLYAEQRSVVDGKTYDVDGEFRYRCGIEEKTRKVTFAPATGKVTYSIGDYAGHNAWDIDVPEPGDYILVCESEKQFVMAIGQGVGSAIVVAVVGLVPFIIGLAMVLIVFFKRRRQRKGA
jgi:NADH:ubiquinone oxidoreductase subunit K